MSSIWVVAADTTRARVFSAETRNSSLVEQFDLVNPEARLHERDLTSDLSGRAANSATGRSSSYGGDEKHKPESVRQFARLLADRLEHERARGTFKRLHIVAEPSFLGELRQALNDNTAAVVAGSVNKNLTRVSVDEIRSALGDFM